MPGPPRFCRRAAALGGRGARFAVVSSGAGYSASMAARTRVIKVTAGREDPGRGGRALPGAAGGVAGGAGVSLGLAAEPAWLALRGRADDIVLPPPPPLADLLAS